MNTPLRSMLSISRLFKTLLASALLSGTIAHNALADTEFLEPEQAFQMTAKAIDDKTVEVNFTIADGYYLYKNKIKVSADDKATLGDVVFPTAERKVDPQFGETDIYRHALLLPVIVKQANGAFTLTVKAQGCADAGLCYPPFTLTAEISLKKAAAQVQSTTITSAATRAVPSAPVIIDESTKIGAMLTSSSLPLILISFFGFGLLLAFTPCVFPMIPILSGIIVGHGDNISKQRALLLSVTYVLGMALTYTAAGVAAGMSGTLLSAALQNAWVLGSFAFVFVMLSLSMFGFYELQLPASLQGRLSDSANRQGGSITGVFVMGSLSALIVGPCVAAPLAGALLYIAQTKDAILGGAALFSMALGMGAPLVLVGVAARTALPKAGMWMEGVKKIFGVMLLGVAIWLVTPVLPIAAVMIAWSALLLFSAIYLHAFDSLPHDVSGAKRFLKGAGVMAALAGAALFLGALAGSTNPWQPLAAFKNTGSTTAVANVTTFEKVTTLAELETRLANADRPVMLDFYADWCVSCQEMEHLTFADKNVQARLGQMDLLQVDVTDNSDHDKALLKRFQLFGPPATVLFAAGSNDALHRTVGFQSADVFSQMLDRVFFSTSK